MARAHEDIFRKLWHREKGQGRVLCKCRKCGYGPINIAEPYVTSEPCDECGKADWRELTEEEFASETDLSDYLKLQSDYLAAELENLYEGDSRSSEWTKVLRKLVKGLEGFGDGQTADWLKFNLEKRPKIVEYLIDDLYTREFLKKARKMVDRTMKLAAMTPKATLDQGVDLYLREATRSWIAGHYEASVALSRSALELALKHRVMEKAGSLPKRDKDEGELQALIRCARLLGLIDDAYRDLAEEVRQDGNKVVHKGSQVNEDRAQHIVECTRGVLGHLYS